MATGTAAWGSNRRGSPGGRRSTDGGGWFDEAGYLYVAGRMDDVIVRGGENLSPGEIEDVLVQHPAVADAAVPDDQWGEVVAAVVVPHAGATLTPEEIVDHAVGHLRSSRRPATVDIREQLPVNDTGKVLRRVLREELTSARRAAAAL